MQKAPLRTEQILGKLRERILSVRTDQILRITPERILAQELGISRVCLREAIKVLRAEGLLIQKRGSGTYVTPKSRIDNVQLVLAPDIKPHDPFYLAFLAELSNRLALESIRLSVINPFKIDQVPTDKPLIIIGVLETNILKEIKNSHRHIIATQPYPDEDGITQVCLDDYSIGYRAARKILEYNHRRALLLSGPKKYLSAFYRRKGFLDVVQDSDVELIELPVKMNWSSGFQAAESIIPTFSKNANPTAAFAANDWLAIGFIQKLIQEGVRIPRDISVVGCDDIPLASEIVPKLTTFKWDFKSFIAELFSLMNEMYFLNNNVPKKVLLPARFIERETLIRI